MRPTRQNAWLAAAILLALLGSLLSWHFWPELKGDTESTSTTLRNIALVNGGVVAAVLAIWRSKVAENQVDASQLQADTAQFSFLNDRYERGATALGSAAITERLAAIYSLDQLAGEHPDLFETQALDLLCAFIRNARGSQTAVASNNATKTRTLRWQPTLAEDLQAAITVVGHHPQAGTHRESRIAHRLNLRHANLEGADLDGLDLSQVDLSHAILTDARCRNVNFTRSALEEATLHNTRLSGADLSRANLRGCKMVSCIAQSAKFRRVHFTFADLSGANLARSDLRNTTFRRTTLKQTSLREVDLSGARIQDSDLTHADVTDTDLTGASLGYPSENELLYAVKPFMKPVNVTQEQLDSMHAATDSPPGIYFGVVDPVTGNRPKWNAEHTK